MFYDTDVSRGGKYVLVTRDTNPGLLLDVYDVESGTKLYSRPGFIAQFIGDGEEVVVPEDYRFKVYETRSGKLLRQSEENHHGCFSFRVAPGARHLVYWTEKGYVLFDLKQMKEQHRWDYESPGPENYATGFHFTTDGKRLLLQPGRHGRWLVWDMEKNRAAGDFPGLAGVQSVSWLFPDGKTAAAARDGKSVRLDLRTGTVVEALKGVNTPGAIRGTYSRSGGRFAARFADGQFLVYSLPFGDRELGRFQLPADDLGIWPRGWINAWQAISEDDRYAALLTTRSLYILRLPGTP